MASRKNTSKLIKKRVMRVDGVMTHVYVKVDLAETKPAKKIQTSFEKEVRAKAKLKIANESDKKRLLNKYAGYPHNLKLMTDSKWKRVSVSPGGVKKKINRIDLTEREFKGLLKDNGGLLYKIVSKYAYNPDHFDDLRGAGIRAIYEAANNYHSKYNPKNPVDVQKHMASQIDGYVQAELSRQLATTVQLPYHKKRLYSKYRALYDEHSGDYDKIYDSLSLKKRDLYPGMGPEGDFALPKHGYVTLTKDVVLKKKIEAHEKRVSKIEAERDKKLESLELRSQVIDEDTNSAFEAGIKVVSDKLKDTEDKIRGRRKGYEVKKQEHEKKIEKLKASIEVQEKKLDSGETKSNKALIALSKKLNSEKDELTNNKLGKDFVKMLTDVSELKRRKSALEKEFKPISSSDLVGERRFLNDEYKDKLRQAKVKFDKETGKTTIPGAYSLFKQFDEISSLKTFSLTDAVGDENSSLKESKIADFNALSHDEVLELKTEYKKATDRLLFSFANFLDGFSELAVMLHLGLHQRNELQPHGLWGFPMSLAEVARKMPSTYFSRNTDSSSLFHAELNNWKKRKPDGFKKEKLDDKVYRAEVKKWNALRDKGKKEISRWLSKTGKGKSKNQKENFRSSVYKKLKATQDHFPKKFKTTKLSKTKLISENKTWKSSRPKKNFSEESRIKMVERKVGLSKELIKRIVPYSDIENLLDLHNKMIKYSVRKSELKSDIMKSFVFNKFFTL